MWAELMKYQRQNLEHPPISIPLAISTFFGFDVDTRLPDFFFFLMCSKELETVCTSAL